MIEYIRGKIVELTPATATIETADGLGYLLNISLNTYASLEGRETARLLVHEAIREDAWVLYGFSDERERSLFRALIGVSGVGAATARIILSSYSAVELESVISSGDVRALKNVKGIGAKTAERIIVDLRDKIKPGDDTLLEGVSLGRANRSPEAMDEALAALVMLGFTRTQSQKVLKKLFDAEPTLKVDVAIKKALAVL
ncbi:MAG: Holliday junction branch migration protein RuvA [Muribaculaceae bacterium]|nr:Holliday junction branch migration protein RuvA [Muribaculaceae bacterium]